MDREDDTRKQRLRRGDIVIVPSHYTDLTGYKLRPAVIISNDTFNLNTQDCIVVPLTGNLKKRPYSIYLFQDDFVTGNIFNLSIIRVDKIIAIEKSKIRQRIGAVKTYIINEIIKTIETIFM